ncbi:carbon catabolite repressor protein 4 homolog 1-like [Papaver somniferum]|uniref:carbon catabolite repressor protein 4 homolog 1-like n=1 Tax=Papaver somniferum TaxID=3469 RepID=UPI000E701766|nr:carbon catabolite repressor protein 4 homolog 1-like [Papaver somniferum]
MIYDEKICLCFRVQSDHFDEFFAPELDKHGYQALYKKKTTEVYTGTYAIDGCATFFRRDRFSHVKKYEVEFNKAAQSLTDVVVPITQKKAALSRLLKDNVALIAVLEAKFSNHGADTPGKRQLLCVDQTAKFPKYNEGMLDGFHVPQSLDKEVVLPKGSAAAIAPCWSDNQ